MTKPSEPFWRRWLLVLPFSAVFIALLGWLNFPNYMLLGAMAGGIVVAVRWRAPDMPAPLFSFAQSIIGCLMAATFDAEALREVANHGVLYVAMVLSVFFICAALGWVLAKKRVLPGTTAIWGTAPGAASIMTIMSADFGADSRLVALMQYSRVLMVTFAAIGIASLHGADAALPRGGSSIFEPFAWGGFLEALLLCVVATVIGLLTGRRSVAILLPLAAGFFCMLVFGMEIALPRWMILGANLVFGWSIGFRFTMQVLVEAYQALPHIVLTFAGMIVLCGAVGVGLGYVAGIDPLTAYLATSPGGIDVITLITVSVGGNAPFVVAVQLARFLITLLTGPKLALFVAKRLNRVEGP